MITALHPKAKAFVIDVLIERRYTQLVKKSSRFWNVSGLQAKLGASGVNVNLTSVPALINGAIAFDSPQAQSLRPIRNVMNSILILPKASAA